MDEITKDIYANFDVNQDGEFDEGEFLELCTYLDEDQSLTDEEKAWALKQYAWAKPDCPIWLTFAFSSAAGGEEAKGKLNEEDFMTFGAKLGGEEEDLEEMFKMGDEDGSGDLGLWEQVDVWWSLLQDTEE